MLAQKNVLFITIDQLRADVVHGELGAFAEMPNLRALMQDAVTFARHYSVTNPCGPSRASLLTGQYAMNHRSIRNGTPLRHDIPSIASEVRKCGYDPMLYGYTDTSQDPRALPKGDPGLTTYETPMTGFREMVEMRLEESYPWRADLLAKGYDIPAYSEFYIPAAQDGQPRQLSDPAFYKAEDSDTSFLTNAFLKELSVRCDEPWFSHLTYIRPHPPLVAPAPYNKMYDPKTLPSPQAPEDAGGHPFFEPARASHPAGRNVHGFPEFVEDSTSVQTLRAVYLGLATEVDANIGRVLQALRDNGQYNNTLIIVTADHGEMLGDHGMWGKMSCFDAAYHTPLIIRDPNVPEVFGSRINKITEAIDIAPTILTWLGQEVPASMDGMALQPFLNNKAPTDWREHSYSELDFGNHIAPTFLQSELGLGPDSANLAILRTTRHTLVHFNGGLPPLLFDHHNQGEARNIAQDPEAAPVLLELTRALLNHRMTYADGTLSNTLITADGPVTGLRQSPRR